MNDIYVTAEYPNPPIRYIPIHQPCGIRVEEYTPPSIKEKIKAYINSIYSTKCLKRKETQEMKFGIGDHVSELELVGSYKVPAKFTKADLKDGMVVEYRNGDRRLVLNEKFIGKKSHTHFYMYNDNLMAIGDSGIRLPGFEEFDIVRIYETDGDYITDIFDACNLELIWERKEEPKPKYKVGDRVKVRADLTSGKEYDPPVEVSSTMAFLYAGKICTIRAVEQDDDVVRYRLENIIPGDWDWAWTEGMFEGLVDYEEMTVAEIEKKLGYKVKIVDGE